MSRKIWRPVVRYYGGKFRLAPKIIPYFGPHRIYTETFGGGASTLLLKKRSYAEIYNDLDDEIVNAFRVIRDHGMALSNLLAMTPYAQREFELAYEPTEDPLEQARRTVIRGFMGHGSSGTSSRVKTGFRHTARKQRQHPSLDWVGIPMNMLAVCERLQGVVIVNKPAIDVLTANDYPDSLHYVDPPYVPSTRSWIVNGSKSGYKHDMTEDDHRELAEVLRSLRGSVIVSGYKSDLYDQELFYDWSRVEMSARADRNKATVECLWLNDAACRNMPQKILMEA